MTDSIPSPSKCAVAVVWTGPDRLSGYLQRLGSNLRECLVLDPAARPKRPDTGAEVTHLSGLPGLGAGEVELIRFSLPDLVALYPASDELRALYPSIREIERFPVAVLEPDTLRDRTDAFEGPLTLVVDTPGGERETFEAIQAAGILDRTSDVLLRCGREALFEGGWTGEEVLTWLQARHFRVVGSVDSDPDWPEFTLRFDPASRRIAELESELAAVTARLVARDKALAEARDADATAAEMIESLHQTVAQLKDEQETLRAGLAEHQAKAAQAETALKDAQDIAGEAEAEAARQHAAMTSQIADLREKLAAAEAEASGHAAARAELQKKLTQHEAALADARSLREKLAAAEAEASGHAAARAELQKKLTQHEAALADARSLRDELDEVKTELSVAIRMQSLAEDDLRELQGRFRKVNEMRQEQTALLMKLVPHLKALRQQMGDRPAPGDPGAMRTIDHVPDDPVSD